ncbi:pheophytinase, chloroplastic-like [Andrographis paniculata]|uniref:pheophytinase, chloroplastic-like n=1 Tax=Andrographis paniculata TaxID=175694 RepID=UPI0021E730EC|nr:pheophytinase, chloroplastic-like [Andrographis paniculata]XP_051147291.1 pheophytinase, chloroplastic-like [Andrographis paniculata]
MEIIHCHGAHRSYVINFRGVNSSKQCRSKLPIERERIFCPVIIGLTSSQNFYLNRGKLKRLGLSKPSSVVCTIERYEHVNSGVLDETYESYVLDREQGVRGVPSSGTIPRVSIPSLPDENNGNNAAQITSWFWEWRPKLKVHYEISGSDNVDSPPILLLPGFGVGSFHYKKQLKDLGRDHRVWALDFLGQGLSLPYEDPTLQSKDGQNGTWGFGDESETWAEELVYSADLWKDQIHYFVEEVIKEPVYLVGNSLGGFMALYCAACYPHLVKGITLLNATPFWAFLPNPIRSPRLSRLFPWAGTFPLPSGVRKLIGVLWQKISDPRSIADILKQVYADHSTNVDDVFSRIVETTQHPAAAASFASIMFAPRGELSLKEALCKCQMNNIPICLMYGKEDPWVLPIFGLQVKRQARDAPYYEISPAGHCPHDEVPEVVNFLVRGWIKNVETGGSAALPLLDGEPANTLVTKDLEFSRRGRRKSVRVQFHGSEFSAWDLVRLSLKPLINRMAAG